MNARWLQHSFHLVSNIVPSCMTRYSERIQPRKTTNQSNQPPQPTNHSSGANTAIHSVAEDGRTDTKNKIDKLRCLPTRASNASIPTNSMIEVARLKKKL